MKYALLFMITLLSACFHTKKAIKEFSKRVDSTGFFRASEEGIQKVDTTTATFDFQDLAIIIDYDIDHSHIPTDDTVQPAVLKWSQIKPEKAGQLRSIIKQLSNKDPARIQITIGSGQAAYHNVSKLDSGKRDQLQKHKTIIDTTAAIKDVDRHGTGIGFSIALPLILIAAILILLLTYWTKIKSFFKDLL